MRNIFIDLGAGSGDDIKGYYNLAPENKFHEIHAFEPNPSRVSQIQKRFPNVTVYNAAAGVKDAKSKLYLGNHPNTNSLLEEKVSINVNNYIEVQEMDFCKWMKENFAAEDYITLVIDIEGGEYQLLQEMYNQDLWSWIDQIYVEFHGEKLANFDMRVEDNLTKQLVDFYGKRTYIYRKHQHEQFLN